MSTIENTVLKSKEYFDSGYGCAESVLLAVSEYLNIKSDLIPRIASGFCGGVARTNRMCGAVTGGIMSINIVHGRNKSKESKDDNYELVQLFLKKFNSQFGSASCPKLTGVDLSTEERLRLFEKSDLHTKCADFTSKATRIVLKLIENFRDEQK